jgi:type I restriction enzyme M protein
MANAIDNTPDLDYADKLRGAVDAAEYKHVVLGLLFLKYISDSFESRRVNLKEELEKDGIKGEHLEASATTRTSRTSSRVITRAAN